MGGIVERYSHPEGYESPALGTPEHLKALLGMYIESHANWREGAQYQPETPERRELYAWWMEHVKKELRAHDFGCKIYAAMLLENWPEFVGRRYILSHPSTLAAYLELWVAVREGLRSQEGG